MKILHILLFFLVSYISVYCQNSNNFKARIKESFNQDWKFKISDNAVYNTPSFDDSNWRKLDLPHDWSVEYDFSKNNSGRNSWLPGGIGWYRKQFIIPKNYENKHIEIQFDGIYRHSEIWVNGEHVGNQYDGFTSFYFDISPYLKFGEPNTIAIKVDNSEQPNCRWYTGSGIYRNTWLIVLDKLHVNNWGTYITTPTITKEKAVINVETTVENFKGKTNFDLKTILFDAKGVNVASASTEVQAHLMKQYVIQQEITITSPELWSSKTPNIYTAITQVIINNKVVDDYKSNFGIRTIEFDAEKGFFLNGKSTKIKGVCLHQDAGVLGTAIPIEIWKHRLKKLKLIGCNAIRTAHNPTSPEFMDLCDKMGFMVMDEFVDKWYDNKPWSKKKSTFFNPNGFGDPNFYLEWQKNYQQTVFRDRNHPSVIIWSVGNENHSPEDNRQRYGLKKYASYVRTLDPTRPVISGMERGKDTNPSDKVTNIIKTTSYMDLIAMNYGEQWVKEIGKRKSGKPFLSTESYIYFNSSPEKRFANIERLPWLDVVDNEHNIGLFLWAGIDYLGESKKFPKIGSTSGLLDLAGFRKERSYLYEALWSNKPMVRIAIYEGSADDFSTSGRWGWPPINESWNLEKGKSYDLVTYTNCESVNLYLSGKKIGNKQLKDFPNWIMKWRNINYESGTLKAVGVINGKEVCEFKLETAGKPHSIDFKTENQKKDFIEGDIIPIEIHVLDKKGNPVSHEDLPLNFELEGPGQIIGLSNGDINDTTSFSNINSHKTNGGKCLVILKAGKNKGPLTLKVTSAGIKSQACKLMITPFGY